MSPPARAFSSSVATKLVIGITGLLLFLYLVIHIAGNLLVFFGPAVFNRYAFVMEHGNPLVPVIEVGLLLIALLHVYKTVTMFLSNKSARPVSYEKKRFAGKPSRKTIASSTMIVSGLWLLLFLIIHVKTFKFSPEYPWPAGGRDLYRQEMETFTSPLMVGFYILSMLVVGSHLWHGVSSSLQSLGFDYSGHPTWTPTVLAAGKVVAVLMAGGFIVIALWAHFAGGQL
jgi:succinate dehydrogenase / fumarate reductase, cytochrome b subunit